MGDGSVSIENITDALGTLMVNGPNSLEALAKLAPAVDWASLKFYDHREVELLPGIFGRAMKVSFTGEEGVELHISYNNIGRVYEALMAAEPRLCDWGGFAMGSFRLEKGIKAAGSDFTKDHTALEAGLDRFCQIDKKDFIGRDALLEQRDNHRQHHTGQPPMVSKLMEVHSPNGIDCVGNEPLVDRSTGETVGFVTSGGWGYMVEKSIAFGYIGRDSLSTLLAVWLLGELYDITVRETPFMDMAAQRAKKTKVAQTEDIHDIFNPSRKNIKTRHDAQRPAAYSDKTIPRPGPHEGRGSPTDLNI